MIHKVYDTDSVWIGGWEQDLAGKLGVARGSAVSIAVLAVLHGGSLRVDANKPTAAIWKMGFGFGGSGWPKPHETLPSKKFGRTARGGILIAIVRSMSLIQKAAHRLFLLILKKRALSCE